jgi:hypothetical protein
MIASEVVRLLQGVQNDSDVPNWRITSGAGVASPKPIPPGIAFSASPTSIAAFGHLTLVYRRPITHRLGTRRPIADGAGHDRGRPGPLASAIGLPFSAPLS